MRTVAVAYWLGLSHPGPYSRAQPGAHGTVFGGAGPAAEGHKYQLTFPAPTGTPRAPPKLRPLLSVGLLLARLAASNDGAPPPLSKGRIICTCSNIHLIPSHQTSSSSTTSAPFHCWLSTFIRPLFLVLSAAMSSDAPGLASSPEAPKPKPWLDKPSQAKSLASGGLGLGLGVTEAQAKGSSRGLEGGK
ncbi:hypothetical protein DFH08DRAFT_944107 [Mycena albidolilacea]|uniref:Uncharacterized protein n=1 Tax=Mycena albidolilacea TaxID=1033008 RepID=A0AAD7EBM9_9AGAR|nr:hypothetical protein DFH08DRAFT_944107 [Mycena albidolilacea]